MNPDVTTTADLDQALKAEPLPVLAKNRGEPVFRDSWEAEAFAIGNILVKDERLSCRQWMDLMAAAIQTAQAAGDPDQRRTRVHPLDRQTGEQFLPGRPLARQCPGHDAAVARDRAHHRAQHRRDLF